VKLKMFFGSLDCTVDQMMFNLGSENFTILEKKLP